MYLSRKQISALEMALIAMDYRNSGAKDEEQMKAYDTIVEMLHSGRKAAQKASKYYHRKKEVRSQ